MEGFNIWMLGAWLGLFLFGMLIFEDTLSTHYAQSVKKRFSTFTKNIFSSIVTGTAVTSILQSSTIVSMLMLWFVRAGILSLHQGIGIIIGANLGSTMTPWLISLIGFKIDIGATIFPVISLGCLLMIMGSKYPGLQGLMKICLSCGLLFLWLDYMKESVDALTQVIDLQSYAHIGLWGYILIGLIITVILQTSTSTSVITLTALNSWLISFPMAVGLMIGANLGSALSTCMVAFLSTSGEQRLKRMIALTHVIFNVLTASVIIAIRPYLMEGIEYIFPHRTEPVLALALFHTVFNIIGLCLLSPFVTLYAPRLERRFPMKTHRIHLALEHLNTSVAEEVIAAYDKDMRLLFYKTLSYLHMAFMGKSKKKTEHITADTITELYRDIKMIEKSLTSFSAQYDTSWYNDAQKQIITNYQLILIDIISAVKHIRDVSSHITLIENDGIAMQAFAEILREKIERLIEDSHRILTSHNSFLIEEKIHTLQDSVRDDDIRFLENIQTTIKKSNLDKDSEVLMSLLKVNRYVVLASQSIVHGLGMLHDQEVKSIEGIVH